MTRSDTSRQLSQSKEVAISALLEGKTDAQAGEVAGVTRQTVNEWRNRDSVFAAELNKRRMEIWRAQKEALRSLVSPAIDALRCGLESSDERVRLAAAINLLKAVGLYGGHLGPVGQTDPKAIKESWERERKERELRRTENEVRMRENEQELARRALFANL